MIEAGTSKPAPFDVVIVHSFSRFFRDHFELEFYVRKLAKNGVKLVSITQEMGDDPMHVMMRQIMALFDEYQSKENAKHVIRALKENARQGFWNGSLPPIGYRVVAAEQRGAKVKKKLEIDPLHAETVRLIYRLALHGDGAKGQMGVKNIVSHLNRNRIFTRDGGRWGIGQVHRILTRRTYMGEHEFNKRAKSKELKPVSEIVVVPVPPLIERETFDAVQLLLKSRHPTVTPSAVISGPTLLTGLIHCARCGGAMTIRTGKGGRYRYYACSMKARQGPTACEGMAVPMDKLDDLVASHLEDRLLQPERLETILATVLDRRQERSERQREHIAELNKRAAESESRLKRLYDAIEAGVADLDDPALKDRIDGLKAIRDQAKADAERAQAMLENSGSNAVTPQMVRTLAETARRHIRLEGGGYRRDHLRALAQRVEVADREVRIMGSKTRLLQALNGKSSVNSVPTQGLKWRRGRDSNPRCPYGHNGFRDRRIRPLCHPSAGFAEAAGRSQPPGRKRGGTVAQAPSGHQAPGITRAEMPGSVSPRRSFGCMRYRPRPSLVALPDHHRAVAVVVAVSWRFAVIVRMRRLPGQVRTTEIGGVGAVQRRKPVVQVDRGDGGVEDNPAQMRDHIGAEDDRMQVDGEARSDQTRGDGLPGASVSAPQVDELPVLRDPYPLQQGGEARVEDDIVLQMHESRDIGLFDIVEDRQQGHRLRGPARPFPVIGRKVAPGNSFDADRNSPNGGEAERFQLPLGIVPADAVLLQAHQHLVGDGRQVDRLAGSCDRDGGATAEACPEQLRQALKRGPNDGFGLPAKRSRQPLQSPIERVGIAKGDRQAGPQARLPRATLHASTP
jgi:site-specific DNA recombinase